MPIKLTDHTWFGAQAWRPERDMNGRPRVMLAFYTGDGQVSATTNLEAAEDMLNHLQQAIWDAKSPVPEAE